MLKFSRWREFQCLRRRGPAGGRDRRGAGMKFIPAIFCLILCKDVMHYMRVWCEALFFGEIRFVNPDAVPQKWAQHIFDRTFCVEKVDESLRRRAGIQFRIWVGSSICRFSEYELGVLRTPLSVICDVFVWIATLQPIHGLLYFRFSFVLVVRLGFGLYRWRMC